MGLKKTGLFLCDVLSPFLLLARANKNIQLLATGHGFLSLIFLVDTLYVSYYVCIFA